MTDPATATPVTETEPPAAPRPMTPTARRRCWMEPRVRIWWTAALVLLVVSVGWTLRQYLTWHRQASLVRHGTRIEATIYRPQDFNAGGRIANRRIQAGADATLVWTVDGTEYTGRATFPETVISGQTAPIWIDGDDPARWTHRGEIPPLGRELVVLVVLVPALLLSALAALFMRQRVAGIWRNGQARRAIVMDSHRSALSPLSRQVRCSLAEGRDNRLITITIPLARGMPVKGETLYILAPPNRPEQAVAARVFG